MVTIMENFLKQFANTSTEIISTNSNLSVSPEFYGTIDISKGMLKMTISFYARFYKLKYENCISLDDWDIQETTNISFGGAPIDDLSALKKMMESSGLKTMANGLEITNEEYKREICIQVERSKLFKDIYGKKAVMHNLLSEEAKDNVHLNYAIHNYEKMNVNSFEIQKFLIRHESGEKEMPTLEELTNLKK